MKLIKTFALCLSFSLLCLSIAQCGNPSITPVQDNARIRIVEITKENLQNFMDLTKPVIIEVYSNRCVYCKRLEPVMHALAKEMSDKYQFAKLSLDREPALVESFNVRSFPTILFLHRGKEVGRHVGFMTKESFKKEIEKTFSS